MDKYINKIVCVSVSYDDTAGRRAANAAVRTQSHLAAGQPANARGEHSRPGLIPEATR